MPMHSSRDDNEVCKIAIGCNKVKREVLQTWIKKPENHIENERLVNGLATRHSSIDFQQMPTKRIFTGECVDINLNGYGSS